MLDFLRENLNIIKLYLPLGIIGALRWLGWIVKKSIALSYRSPTAGAGKIFNLSVITPVYNEDPGVFAQALNSWKEAGPDEIIAVIDSKDKANIEIFKKFSSLFLKAKLIITTQRGKRAALAEGIKASKNQILALVDSDTIWMKDFALKSLHPFSDSSVGGVATRQEVLKPDTLARKIFDIQLFSRYFTELPFLAKTGNALTVISGRTALYRREAIISLVNDLTSEKFWGVLCVSGDDKALTNLIQAKGWKVKYLQNSYVMTPGAPDFLTFFKQHVRWSRNSWRSDFKMVFSPWLWQREKILGLYLLDRFLQPFILLLGPIYFVLTIFLGYWQIAAVLFFWWILSRSIKILPYLRRYPGDIFIMPVYIVVTYILAVIKIYAMFSLNSQGWITRWDKSRQTPLRFFRRVPAIAATLLVILAISFFVIKYKNNL